MITGVFPDVSRDVERFESPPLLVFPSQVLTPRGSRGMLCPGLAVAGDHGDPRWIGD